MQTRTASFRTEGLEHTRALEFLRDCAAGGELLGIAWITVMSYLRMATHPRLFAAPLSPAEAERNVSALISRPHVRSGMTDAQPR